jgi:hypothetical protein
MILHRSRYRGVRPSGNPELPWYALHKVKGVPITYGGPFATEREAARDYDAFVRSLGPCNPRRLNFPREVPAPAPGTHAPPPPPITDAERREVLTACREILDDGLFPSADRLVPRFRGASRTRLRQIRDEAIEAGLITPGPRGGHGLLGRTAADLEEVKERTARVRAEKVARGEVPRPVEMKVIRDRQYDRWFMGRS